MENPDAQRRPKRRLSIWKKDKKKKAYSTVVLQPRISSEWNMVHFLSMQAISLTGKPKGKPKKSEAHKEAHGRDL